MSQKALADAAEHLIQTKIQSTHETPVVDEKPTATVTELDDGFEDIDDDDDTLNTALLEEPEVVWVTTSSELAQQKQHASPMRMSGASGSPSVNRKRKQMSVTSTQINLALRTSSAANSRRQSLNPHAKSRRDTFGSESHQAAFDMDDEAKRRPNVPLYYSPPAAVKTVAGHDSRRIGKENDAMTYVSSPQTKPIYSFSMSSGVYSSVKSASHVPAAPTTLVSGVTAKSNRSILSSLSPQHVSSN